MPGNDASQVPVLVPVGDIADELVEKFVAAAKGIKVGNGLDEQTFMGPVISAAHKQRVLDYIEKGIRRRCKTRARRP